MLLAPHLAPFARSEIVEERIAVDVREHFGQLDALGQRQEQPEDFRPADHRNLSPASRSASSTSLATSAPSALQSASRVSTMCRRPGNTRGRLSNVFRPMTIALPMVSALNRLRSAEMCHGMVPPRPMTPFWARATTRMMDDPAMRLLWRGCAVLPSALLRRHERQPLANDRRGRAELGAKAVVTDPSEIEPWLTDWRGRVHGEARAILAPKSTEEVAGIVALAAEHRVPLVPQGGNTGMAAGATPPPDGSALILSLRRMNRLRSISAENRLAVAEAGVILADLHERANDVGMRFPLTLGARGSATIGGLTSTNAGGTQVLRFGTMRALVAGVEAVLPDGSVHSGLSALKKDNRGYSLDQLLIGAEGTLGVVTAVALRLVPAVASRAVAWAGVATPADALALLRFLEARTNAVEGFELVSQDSLELVLRHIPGTRAPLADAHPWHVLIEATTADRATDIAAELQRCLAEALEKGLIADAVIAANEAQAEAFWRIRNSISEAERVDGQTLAHDISVPVADMPRFLTEAAARSSAPSPGSSPPASAISATATSTSTSAPAATPRPTGTIARARRSPEWSTTS